MSMSVRTVRIILIFETYSLRIREKVLTLNHDEQYAAHYHIINQHAEIRLSSNIHIRTESI